MGTLPPGEEATRGKSDTFHNKNTLISISRILQKMTNFRSLLPEKEYNPLKRG